jgi:hypothetical protein
VLSTVGAVVEYRDKARHLFLSVAVDFTGMQLLVRQDALVVHANDEGNG